jgi:predicted Zn-dependent protease with MMP-like domain
LNAAPDNVQAILDRAEELIGLGKHAEALRTLSRPGADAFPEPADEAARRFYLGCCLDRAGKAAEADRAFREAERLDPRSQPMPPRLARRAFEEIVRETLDRLPARFRRRLSNVVVRVEDYPSQDDLRAEEGLDAWILGLYRGTPRTRRGFEAGEPVDFITLFKRNLEIDFPRPAELRREIRRTVLHEIAHHFGLEHGDMGEGV